MFKAYAFLFSIVLLNISEFSECFSTSCNFDKDFCDYQPNEFVIRYAGKSPSISSGPSYDHTTGEEGFYALCDGRLLKDPTNKCKLSKDINIEAESDFEFWYYMYGTQIGTLELIKDSEEVLWSLTGRQKNEWLFAQIKIPAGNYLLEFSANRSTLGRTSCDIAIDDVIIEGEELTTIFNTPTRTPVTPISLSSLRNVSFDILNNLYGWRNEYLNNKWIQTNGNMSKFVDSLGPGSDWKSITAFTVNTTTLRPTTLKCAIPFSLEDDPASPLYYCQKITLRKDFACGLNIYPQASDANSLGRCDLGYYMMVTSDKFETAQASYRARFMSPVYFLSSATDFCLNFKYNIYGNGTDGFRVIIENYLKPEEHKVIFTIRGPLYVDRWYSGSAQATSIEFTQIRVIFEPMRGNSADYASVSIDAIDYVLGNCPEPTTTTVTTSTATSTTTTSTTTVITTTTTLKEESTPLETYSTTTASSTTTIISTTTTPKEESSSSSIEIYSTSSTRISTSTTLASTSTTTVITTTTTPREEISSSPLETYSTTTAKSSTTTPREELSSSSLETSYTSPKTTSTTTTTITQTTTTLISEQHSSTQPEIMSTTQTSTSTTDTTGPTTRITTIRTIISSLPTNTVKTTTTRTTRLTTSQTKKPTSGQLGIEEPSEGLGTLYILCIVIGCVVLIALLSYGGYILVFRRKAKLITKNGFKSNKSKLKLADDVEFDEIQTKEY